MSWQSPWDDTVNQIQTHNNDVAQVNTFSQTANPQTAALLAQHAANAPFVDPKVQYAMADSGISPSDPLAQAVAVKSINKKGGGFWHDLGDIISPVTHLVGGAAHAVMSAGGSLAQDIKPEIRGGLIGLDTLKDIGYGAYRDAAQAVGTVGADVLSGAATGAAYGLVGGSETGPGALATGAIGGLVGGVVGGIGALRGTKVQGQFVNPLDQSSGGLIIKNWLSGKPVDVGTGFQAGGKIKEEMEANQKLAASVDGMALTPGRMLADSVAHPNSMPFNLMSGVLDAVTVTELDPASRLTEGFGEAGEESGKILNNTTRTKVLMQKMGLTAAADKSVAGDIADNFLATDPAALKFAEKGATMNSASDIRNIMGKKIPWDIADQLATADTPEAFTQVLRNGILNGKILEKQQLDMGNSISQSFRTWRSGSRLLGNMPGNNVSMMDAFDTLGNKMPKFDKAVDQVVDWAKQARMGDDLVKEAGDSLAKVQSPAEFQQVVHNLIGGHYVPQLRDLGYSEEDINHIVGKEYYRISKKVLGHYQNVIANGETMNTLKLADATHIMPKENHLTENLLDMIPLPNAREMRRVTTPNASMRALINSPYWQSPIRALDTGMKIWQPLHTHTVAWGSRIFALDSARSIGAGLEMPLDNPLTLAKMAIQKGERPGAATDAEGELLSSLAENHRSQIGLLNTDRNSANAFMSGKAILAPGDPGHGASYAAHLLKASQDPLAQRIATHGLDQAVTDFVDGDLKSFREHLATTMNRPDLLDAETAEKYARDTIGNTVKTLTNGDPQLLDAIAKGELPGGVKLAQFTGKNIINPEAAKWLDRADYGPAALPGLVLQGRDPDKSVDTIRNLFRATVSKPINQLVRIPAFNQFYWKHMSDMAGLLTPEAQEQLLKNIAGGNTQLSEGAIKELKETIEHSSGAVELKDASQLAAYKAGDSMNDLFMDFSNKSAWQDAMRLVMPFSGMWEKELTSWAKLFVEHPVAIRQAQLATEEGTGSGFFYKDENGQLVFNYPASGMVSDVVAGIHAPLVAKVSGLSGVTTSLLPRFGPIASIAASKLIPNKPQFDSLKALFSPYGDPTQAGVSQAILPSYMKSIQEAMSTPQSDVKFGNMTMDVMRYLMSTGNYETNTQAGQQKLMDDAISRSKHIFLLQAAGQFTLPSAPALAPPFKDKTGSIVAASTLAKDYAAMEQKDINTAPSEFLKKYGDNAILFLQGNTKPIAPATVNTDKGYAWQRENPDMVKKLPNTFAFFAPPGGNFDYTAYLNSIQNGQRVHLKPQELVNLANDKVASMIYYNAKDQLGPKINRAQQAGLATLKQVLTQAYPGFGNADAGLPTKVAAPALIDEIKNGMKDPDIANTPVGTAAGAYLQIREAVLKALTTKEETQPSLKTQQAEPYAAFLVSFAQRLSQTIPAFSLLFDRVFSRELPDSPSAEPLAPPDTTTGVA